MLRCPFPQAPSLRCGGAVLEAGEVEAVVPLQPAVEGLAGDAEAPGGEGGLLAVGEVPVDVGEADTGFAREVAQVEAGELVLVAGGEREVLHQENLSRADEGAGRVEQRGPPGTFVVLLPVILRGAPAAN
jgi:hypothetical protein